MPENYQNLIFEFSTSTTFFLPGPRHAGRRGHGLMATGLIRRRWAVARRSIEKIIKPALISRKQNNQRRNKSRGPMAHERGRSLSLDEPISDGTSSCVGEVGCEYTLDGQTNRRASCVDAHHRTPCSSKCRTNIDRGHCGCNRASLFRHSVCA